MLSGDFDIVEAVDGIDGVRVAEKLDRVDLIMCDFNMPGLDGLELVRRVKELERFATTPVIMVTSLIVDATKSRGWYYASIVDNLVNYAQGVYGVRPTAPDWAPSFLILLLVCAGAFGTFLWRILKLEVAE